MKMMFHIRYIGRKEVKGKRIQPQFLFLMEKSILYAKITVSKKNCFKTKF